MSNLGLIFAPRTHPGSHRPRVAPCCVRRYSSPSPRHEGLYRGWVRPVVCWSCAGRVLVVCWSCAEALPSDTQSDGLRDSFTLGLTRGGRHGGHFVCSVNRLRHTKRTRMTGVGAEGPAWWLCRRERADVSSARSRSCDRSPRDLGAVWPRSAPASVDGCAVRSRARRTNRPYAALPLRPPLRLRVPVRQRPQRLQGPPRRWPPRPPGRPRARPPAARPPNRKQVP
jgi:hypothetical protein